MNVNFVTIRFSFLQSYKHIIYRASSVQFTSTQQKHKLSIEHSQQLQHSLHKTKAEIFCRRKHRFLSRVLINEHSTISLNLNCIYFAISLGGEEFERSENRKVVWSLSTVINFSRWFKKKSGPTCKNFFSSFCNIFLLTSNGSLAFFALILLQKNFFHCECFPDSYFFASRWTRNLVSALKLK